MTANTRVPKGWSTVELPEVVDIAYGKNLPTTRLTDKGFAVYGANGQIGFYSEYNCKESEVLITCRGATCGTINVSPPKTFVTNNSMVLRPHDPALIDRDYLRAAMLATDKSKVITGTAQPQITVANLSKHQIGLAPFNEQRRIVAKIEDLAARSRAAKEALDAIPPLLERFRQSVLAAAFRGDLTRQWREQNPNVEPASVLLDRIRQERRHRWEQDYLAQQKAKGKTPKDDKWKDKYQEPEPVDTTGLPELPEGWCWAGAEELTGPDRTILYGIIKPGPDTPGGVPYVRICEMKTGTVDVAGLKRCAPERASKFARATLLAGDILISKDGTIGKVAIVPPELEGGNITQHVLRLSASTLLSNRFVARAVESPFCQTWMTGEVRGVALKGINVSEFREMPVPLAPRAEQEKIAEIVDDYLLTLHRITAGAQEGQHRISSLSQSILAKAFRGELVPQDPNDEPASALLERIRADRANNESKGTGRKRSKG